MQEGCLSINQTQPTPVFINHKFYRKTLAEMSPQDYSAHKA